jgi:hypothetical protein
MAAKANRRLATSPAEMGALHGMLLSVQNWRGGKPQAVSLAKNER